MKIKYPADFDEIISSINRALVELSSARILMLKNVWAKKTIPLDVGCDFENACAILNRIKLQLIYKED